MLLSCHVKLIKSTITKGIIPLQAKDNDALDMKNAGLHYYKVVLTRA